MWSCFDDFVIRKLTVRSEFNLEIKFKIFLIYVNIEFSRLLIVVILEPEATKDNILTTYILNINGSDILKEKEVPKGDGSSKFESKEVYPSVCRRLLIHSSLCHAVMFTSFHLSNFSSTWSDAYWNIFSSPSSCCMNK